MAEDEEPFDASFLKDLADIIKNKTLFFIPFFGGAFGVLFTKPITSKAATQSFGCWWPLFLV
jgi:uncharacterized membrane protein YsdA (DUF1294 family)